MLKLILNWLSGGVLDAITGTVQAYLNKEISEEEMKAKLGQTLSKGMVEIAQAQGDVVKTELTGESWLQRNWRAFMATAFGFSYWFVIVPYPFLLAWGVLPAVRFGEQGLENMFYLTVVSVGGYIGGKSVENIVAALTRYVGKK